MLRRPAPVGPDSAASTQRPFVLSRARRAAVATAGVTALLAAATGAPAFAVNAVQPTLVSSKPAAFTPHVMNGSVQSIVQVGGKIVAAGTFTTVRQTATGADLPRNRIFAFDAATGQIDLNFNPDLGGAANSLDTDGTSIYVGGSFGSVGGNTAIKRIVKLSTAGGVDPTFKAVPNAGVNEVVFRAGRLYVGGAFTSVKRGQVITARTALAAVSPTDGAVLPEVDVPFAGVYDPAIGGGTNIKRLDVSADGSRLVAIGNFSKVGGQPRAQVAVLDTSGTPASVAPWVTDRFSAARNDCAGVFDSFVRDVDLSPDGSYFAVTTTGAFAGGAGSGTLCDTTSRWETASTGNDPSWVNYTGGDTTYGVAVTGAAIYVGGHMRWQNNPFQGDQAGPGAVPRAGIAALDPVNGLPLTWNPGRTRGVGAQALYATDQGLWVGSDTNRIAGVVRSRIALMPLAGGKVIPAVAPATLPNDLFLAQRTKDSLIPIVGPKPSPGALLRQAVDGSGAPIGAATTANTGLDWSTVRGAFLVNGTLYYGLGDGGLYARTFSASDGVMGAQRAVNLYDDPETGQRIPFAIASITGMFYDTARHRIYYTVSGDSRLFYRYFTPESEVVGAQTFTAATSVNLSAVAGMTLAGGKVLYGSSDGTLRSVAFTDGQITGGASVLKADGSWSYRAIFLPNG